MSKEKSRLKELRDRSEYLQLKYQSRISELKKLFEAQAVLLDLERTRLSKRDDKQLSSRVNQLKIRKKHYERLANLFEPQKQIIDKRFKHPSKDEAKQELEVEKRKLELERQKFEAGLRKELEPKIRKELETKIREEVKKQDLKAEKEKLEAEMREKFEAQRKELEDDIRQKLEAEMKKQRKMPEKKIEPPSPLPEKTRLHGRVVEKVTNAMYVSIRDADLNLPPPKVGHISYKIGKNGEYEFEYTQEIFKTIAALGKDSNLITLVVEDKNHERLEIYEPIHIPIDELAEALKKGEEQERNIPLKKEI